MAIQALGGREILIDGATQLTVPRSHLSGSRVDSVVLHGSHFELIQGTPGVVMAPKTPTGATLRAVIRVPVGSTYVLDADITEVSA